MKKADCINPRRVDEKAGSQVYHSQVPPLLATKVMAAGLWAGEEVQQCREHWCMVPDQHAHLDTHVVRSAPCFSWCVQHCSIILAICRCSISVFIWRKKTGKT